LFCSLYSQVLLLLFSGTFSMWVLPRTERRKRLFINSMHDYSHLISLTPAAASVARSRDNIYLCPQLFQKCSYLKLKIFLLTGLYSECLSISKCVVCFLLLAFSHSPQLLSVTRLCFRNVLICNVLLFL